MRRTVEREVKLVPPEGFKLPPLGRELPARAFVSTYFDTADLALASRGLTFRHRVEEGTGLWQLKLPHGASRIELEEAGPPARPPSSMVELLVAHLRGRELVRVARLRTRRQVVRAEGAEIVDDSVAVLDGPRVVSRFRELEVELLDGDEEVLRRLERSLRDAGADAGVFTPKLFRALDLTSPAEREPLPADAAPGEVLQVALADQYERLLAHDPGTRLGSDDEDLHQLRVSTRRARAFLRAARPLLDSAWANELRDELGWLGSALGPARDLDVLLAHLRDDIAELDGAGPELDGLLAALEREHEAAREAAVAALSTDRYFALLDRLEQPDPLLVPGVEETLSSLWQREFRRTRRVFDRLGPTSADEELHDARIRVKRARYSAELAAGELGRGGERFLSAAKKLQDVLGEHQDATVAEDRVAGWAGDDPVRFAAAQTLLERERARRREARESWPSAWKLLERRGLKVAE